MGIVLKPLSHPELSPLRIGDNLLVIGRDTAPFDALGDAVHSGLATRHACLFQDADNCYLMDLGTGAGTTRNHQALLAKQPIQLAAGDTLCFAGNLEFRVDHDERPVTPPTPAPVKLALAPAPDSVTVETIVIDAFPFLISRDGMLMVFSECETTVPAAMKTLSRRHAFLFLKDDAPHVMDLDSTNGTWVGNNKITPYTEVPLREDDILAFGGPRLSYTVHLEQTASPEPHGEQTISAATQTGEQTTSTTGLHRVGKTVYIQTVDSFLDIFLDQPSRQEAATPINEKPEIATPAPRSALGKARLFSRELKQALGDEHPRRRKTWLMISALVVALAAGGLYLYYAPQREIKTLIAQDQYRAGLIQAADYLRQHPENSEMSALAMEALVKNIVPDWQAAIEAEHFNTAAEQLAAIQELARRIPEGDVLLALLTWIGDLQAYINERGGRDAPLRLFRDEYAIPALLERWDSAARDFELLSIKIADWIPDFQSLRREMLSQQRLLRNEQIVYLRALTEFERNLRRLLAQGNTNEAMNQLVRFEGQYPKIVGLEALREDIAQLESLQHATRSQQPDTLIRLREIAFVTPWGQELAAAWLEQHLPPPEILDRYQAALAAWRAGETQRAITVLETLTSEPGSAMAAAKLAHFRTVARTFDVLQTNREQPDYGQRLLSFYNTLNPEEDRYFLEALAADLRNQRQALLTQAETLFKQAGSHWSEYQKTGGINGLMRLEETVSARFKQQSQRLARAYEAARRGTHLYDLLGQPRPESARQLHENIVAESKRQRQSFTDLSLVMEPGLMEAKLKLLPNLETGLP